jgi:Flp pilus assembly protein TadG
MPSRRSKRLGTTMVEVAVVLPVFLVFVFGLVEYGRLQMVNHMLKTACRAAARMGSTDGIDTATVQARVSQIMASAIDSTKLTVIVKNAGVFDESGNPPASDVASLPDIELTEAEPRQLFLVRASVAYNDIALAPFSILEGARLHGQSFMRHE